MCRVDRIPMHMHFIATVLAYMQLSFVYMGMHISKYASMHMSMMLLCMCICTYVNMYQHMNACVYVYMYVGTEVKLSKRNLKKKLKFPIKDDFRGLTVVLCFPMYVVFCVCVWLWWV